MIPPFVARPRVEKPKRRSQEANKTPSRWLSKPNKMVNSDVLLSIRLCCPLCFSEHSVGLLVYLNSLSLAAESGASIYFPQLLSEFLFSMSVLSPLCCLKLDSETKLLLLVDDTNNACCTDENPCTKNCAERLFQLSAMQ